MVLAKAWAVASDRIRREAEQELRARDAATELPPEISDQVDKFLDDPASGTSRERPVLDGEGTSGQDEVDSQDDLGDRDDLPPAPQPLPAPEPPRAVNPPDDLPYAPRHADDPALAEHWFWSDAADAWVLQRGRFWVTCQLPKDTQPVFPAHLFGVYTIEPAE
jgi:hypothetical protein